MSIKIEIKGSYDIWRVKFYLSRRGPFVKQVEAKYGAILLKGDEIAISQNEAKIAFGKAGHFGHDRKDAEFIKELSRFLESDEEVFFFEVLEVDSHRAAVAVKRTFFSSFLSPKVYSIDLRFLCVIALDDIEITQKNIAECLDKIKKTELNEEFTEFLQELQQPIKTPLAEPKKKRWLRRIFRF